ncbi:putative endonuclease lcl3 [Steccherinum ochraceum]|uniref:Putative endonuclease lcl3 n=1 Tax=Steccherinum ochraceum TaxID=92696 RepID=A0A4R0RBP8_9APHY|nr:putative endonuclease lcl3 [Steccherinum ochraceum]
MVFWNSEQPQKNNASSSQLKLHWQERIDKSLGSLPPSLLLLSAFVIGSSTTLAGTYVYRRFFRRIPNVDWVTPELLGGKRWVKGYVTSVGDNDNFRLYHTPGIGWKWPLKLKRVPTKRDGLRDQTIHIRLAGIDAPEGSHFGRPGQPYAPEALVWLKRLLLSHSRVVHCKLIRKDQYGRVVSHVYVPGWFGRRQDVAVEMLKAGWAVVYEQSGAEYGKEGKEGLLKLQEAAQRAKLGMWAKGAAAETPSQYKKRYASGGGAADDNAEGQTDIESGVKKGKPKRSWFRWLIS